MLDNNRDNDYRGAKWISGLCDMGGLNLDEKHEDTLAHNCYRRLKIKKLMSDWIDNFHIENKPD